MDLIDAGAVVHRLLDWLVWAPAHVRRHKGSAGRLLLSFHARVPLNLQSSGDVLILLNLPLQNMPLQPVLSVDFRLGPGREVVGRQPMIVHVVNAIVVSNIKGLFEII